MIGVDYGLFWELNPITMRPFVKAFELQQKQNDAAMWKQGYYIRLAVASCLDSKVKYPQSPVMKSNQSERNTVKDKFLMRMKEINARFERSD